MTPKLATRFQRLEAKCDLHLFGVYRGPDGKFYKEDGTEADGAGDFKSLKGAAAAAGAVAGGAGLAAGGVRLAKRYGADQIARPADALNAVRAGVARDVAGAAGAAKGWAQNKGSVAAEAFRKGVSRDKGKFASRSVLRGVKGAISAVTGGRVRFDAGAVCARAIELADKIELPEA